MNRGGLRECHRLKEDRRKKREKRGEEKRSRKDVPDIAF